MQAAFIFAQRLAPDQQELRLHGQLKQLLDLRNWNFTAHHAALILTLVPLISARLSRARMALACSLETSTKECRSRTSTLPSSFPGSPVSPAMEFTMSIGTTPISSPTLMWRRVWSAGVLRSGFTRFFLDADSAATFA